VRGPVPETIKRLLGRIAEITFALFCLVLVHLGLNSAGRLIRRGVADVTSAGRASSATARSKRVLQKEGYEGMAGTAMEGWIAAAREPSPRIGALEAVCRSSRVKIRRLRTSRPRVPSVFPESWDRTGRRCPLPGSGSCRHPPRRRTLHPPLRRGSSRSDRS
jgi:hypothetical protein